MRRILPFLLLAPLCLGQVQIPSRWTPELSMQVKRVSSAVASPDGKLVAYTETVAVMDAETSEFRTHIFLATSDGADRFQLTQGKKGASSPAFTPDSRFVLFQSARTGKPNVFRIPVDGGEAECLTDWNGQLGAFAVSPDGKWLAFAGRKKDEEQEKTAKEKRDFKVIDQNPENHGLWMIPMEADSDGKRKVKELVKPDRHVRDIDWSPDGRHIAFSHTATPSADDNYTNPDISEVEVSSGDVTAISATGGVDAQPRYSPDGARIAFHRSPHPAPQADAYSIVVKNRQSGEERQLPETHDSLPRLLGWASDSESIFFTENKGTRGAIFRMPLNGEPVVHYQRPEGSLSAPSLERTGRFLAFTGDATQVAPEAFFLQVNSSEAVRVSKANAAVPAQLIGRSEVIRWKSADGWEIEGIFTYPAGYEQGKRVPLVLAIHGGPGGVFTESFTGASGIYPTAAFSSAGYAVLRPNPRGSSGYGKKFRFANYADWGGMDYQDIMSGVDHLIKMGVADPDRMAVMGWSYGGFMTSWAITQTDRFDAAVVGAAVTNLISFTGTSDLLNMIPDYFRGETWEKADDYREHSPVTHVGNVTTPALVLHGEKDFRVPADQGHEYYNALKKRGVTTKMVVYPRMPHGPVEPKFTLDIMQRHFDWVEKYVR